MGQQNRTQIWEVKISWLLSNMENVSYDIPFLLIMNSPLLPNECEGDWCKQNWGLPTVVLEV